MHRKRTTEVVGIGAFSQLTGLSIDALRHYHDVGLLIPDEVDPKTGYRRYSLAQAERARRIADLRALGLPLDEVSTVLDVGAPHIVLAALLRHRRRLAETARDAAAKVDELDRLIDKEELMTTPIRQDLRAELTAMFEEQQAHGRALFEQTRASRPDRFLFELDESERPEGYREGADLAHRHALRLADIVGRYGWPGRSLVGDDGAGAAWAIAQHADADNALCEAWLPMMAAAVTTHECAALHLAALTDRVLLRARRPQRYGTVIEPTGGSWRARPPIEDDVALDDRRRAIGLNSLADYIASLPSPDAWYSGETSVAL